MVQHNPFINILFLEEMYGSHSESDSDNELHNGKIIVY